MVGSNPVMGGLALHNYVFPKFLPYQRTGYSTYQLLKSFHQEKDSDLDHLGRPKVNIGSDKIKSRQTF